MSLVAIRDGLPSDLTLQLLSDEEVFYFSYITLQGGCLNSGSRENYWIAISNNSYHDLSESKTE